MNREEMIEAYLERLELTGIDRRPTRQNLQALQQAHLYHIPDENLDVMRGVPLSLEIDDLFRKIVLNHRGGYCFELNGLVFLAAGRAGVRGHRLLRALPAQRGRHDPHARASGHAGAADRLPRGGLSGGRGDRVRLARHAHLPEGGRAADPAHRALPA